MKLTTTGRLSPRPGWQDGARPRTRRRTPARPGTRGSRGRGGKVITAEAANGRIAEFKVGRGMGTRRVSIPGRRRLG